MNIIISIVILILLCFIFYREIKNEKPVDLFINIIISCVCIGTPIYTFLSDGIDFTYIEHIVYLVVIIVAIIFTAYYLIKYFKNKDKIKDDDKDEALE